MKAKMIALAESYGFVHRDWPGGPGIFFEHPRGHYLTLHTWGDFVVKWKDGTYSECKASAFASRYRMTPEDFGAAKLEQLFRERKIDGSHKTHTNLQTMPSRKR